MKGVCFLESYQAQLSLAMIPKASIGKIEREQLIKLMTLRLTESEVEANIIYK